LILTLTYINPFINYKTPITQQVGHEEYYDYLFPEEAGAAPNLKLLEAAYRWKKARTEGGADGGGGGGGGANGGGGASAGAAPGTAGPGGE